MQTNDALPPLHKIIEKPFGTFGYNEELKCMFHFWKGFLSPDEVKFVAETTNAYMEKLGLTNVIADHREMEMFSEQVSEYISSVWLPQLEALRVRTTFVVMSPEAFTQLAAEEMHESARTKSAVEIRHFRSMGDAVAAMREYNRQHNQPTVTA